MRSVVTWTRETPWRQGHVLPQEAVEALGFAHTNLPEATCVIVISHDCDIANDDLSAEPDVEVIIGCLPTTTNGNFSWAKTPRTLHLETIRAGTKVTIELTAVAKCIVSKEMLAAFYPDALHSLSGHSLSILRSWLAVRYNRAAFPDAFNNRLSDSKVDRKLAKLIEPLEHRLSAVYFDIDGGVEIDRSDDSAYELKIVLVYPPGDDPVLAAEVIETLEDAIDKLFEVLHFHQDTNTWHGIELKTCMTISEDDLTVSLARLLTQWRLEHMTLKADREQHD